MTSLFKSPRVLVTNSYIVARKFVDNQSMSVANISLTSSDYQTILLNPFDDSKSKSNSYHIFDSLEYSLGYGDAAGQDNYKIILKLNDYFSDLEETFVHNLLSWNQLLDTANLFESDINGLSLEQKDEVRKTSILGDSSRFPTENSFSEPSQNIERILNSSLIGKSYYFIFINEDGEYLDPLISQFYAATVNQSSKKVGTYAGIKQVKLEFICTGHPNILSNLSDLSKYTPAQLNNSPYKNIPSQFYQVRESIDFSFLINNPLNIDIVVKNIIKKLFQTITGKEVILVLPDFTKLFSYFKNKITDGPITKGMYFAPQNPSLINAFLKNSDYYLLQVFFNKLGFNCVAPSILNVFTVYESLSAKDRQEIEEVNEKINKAIEQITSTNDLNKLLDQLIDEYNKNKTVFGITDPTPLTSVDPKTGAKGFYSLGRARSSDQRFFEFLKFSLEKGKVELGSGYLGDLLEKDITVDNTVIKNTLKDFLYKIISKKLENKGFYKSVSNRLSPPSGKTTNSSSEIDYEKYLKSVSGLLTFTISSDQQTMANQKVKNQIDFYEFANSLSNRLQNIGDFPFKISFTEENNLYRLTKILPFLYSYNSYVQKTFFPSIGIYDVKNIVPLITNPGQPAIVIFESFLYDNYYLPIDGFPRSSPKIGNYEYPISDIDLKNYGPDSLYNKALIQKRVINGLFQYRSINLPFSKYPMSESLPAGGVPTLVYPPKSPIKRTSTQLRLSASIDKILEVLKKWKNEKLVQNLDVSSMNTISIFHFDPNFKGSLIDNVIEYNVKADSMNSTAPLVALVQKIQNQIFDDKLLDQRINKYTELFTEEFSAIRDKMIKFLGKPNEISSYKKTLEEVLKENLDNFRSTGTDIDPLIPQVRSNNVDTSKLSEEERKEYNKALESQEEDNIKRTVNQLLIDCVQDSLRWDKLNAGGKKIINSFLGDKSLIKANLYKMIYEKIYQVEVEAYPFFQINSIANLNSPVLLIIKKNLSPLNFAIYNNPEVAVNIAKELNEGRFYSLLSGMYIIVGFKHTLTGVSAKSNFVLRKSLTSGSEG